MKLLLFLSGKTDSHFIEECLSHHTEHTQVIDINDPKEIEEVPDLTVLIASTSTVVSIGDHAQRVLKKTEGAGLFWICTPQLTGKERKSLLKAGVHALLSPAEWQPEAIATRILGKMLDGQDIPPGYGLFLGGSRAMKLVFMDIRPLAKVKEHVLILGKSGTGKELAAKTLHQQGPNPNEPFLAINCAHLSPELVVSQLFGHKKGAFTGAHNDAPGAFIAAKNGTLFLDEIGELDLQSQAKILRALQEREVTPVGAHAARPFNARLILATNRNLSDQCNDKQFREDLFARFEGFFIELPPLNHRMEDIPLLARHFLTIFNSEEKRNNTLTDEGVDLLFRYHWPRNVRQLEKFVRSAATYAEEESGPVSLMRLERLLQLDQSSSNKEEKAGFSISESWPHVHSKVWLTYSEAVLNRFGGNSNEAASHAGMSRSAFYDKIKKSREQLEKTNGK